MPLVLVTANGFRCSGMVVGSGLKTIGELLTVWVADALTCEDPGGHLAKDDIEVRFSMRSGLDVGGEQYALEVIVFANDFPSRRQNLEERCCAVRDKLRTTLTPDVHGSVWIRLAPAAFAEF